MRRIPDEDCDVTKGKTSRCLRWMLSLDADLGLPVTSLHFTGERSSTWRSTGSQNTIAGRVSQKLSERLWEPCVDQPWSTGVQVRGERGEGQSGGRRRNWHVILFLSSRVQKPKPRKSLLKAPCLVSEEMRKLSVFVPFVSWPDHNLLRWQKRSVFKNQGHLDFPGGSESKESAFNVADPGSIPGLVKLPGEGNGNPLQGSCLENYMDRGVLREIVHRVAKRWTRLSD